jgi:propanol-preferring alcohol dehydrogenase
LLCAGAVGYRALRRCGLHDGEPLGLSGFGASAHLVLQMARHLLPRSRVHVFARDPAQREFARSLGAAWAGDTDDRAPEPLAAVIDTTPAWKPVIGALANLRPGGRLVINAIRKEDGDLGELLRLRYQDHLWMEREVTTVANVTRADVRECLQLAAAMPLRPEVTIYPLQDANRALRELAQGPVRGAKVLIVD